MRNAIRVIVPFGQTDPDDGFVITDLLHIVTVDAGWNDIARFAEALTGIDAATFAEHGDTHTTGAIAPGRFLATIDSGRSGSQVVTVDATKLDSNDFYDVDRNIEERHPEYSVDHVVFEHPASAFVAQVRFPIEPLENGRILAWANSQGEALDVMLAAVGEDAIIEGIRPAEAGEFPTVDDGVIRVAAQKKKRWWGR